jgi:hypothetical protein
MPVCSSHRAKLAALAETNLQIKDLQHPANLSEGMEQGSSPNCGVNGSHDSASRPSFLPSRAR